MGAAHYRVRRSGWQRGNHGSLGHQPASGLLSCPAGELISYCLSRTTAAGLRLPFRSAAVIATTSGRSPFQDWLVFPAGRTFIWHVPVLWGCSTHTLAFAVAPSAHFTFRVRGLLQL